MTDAGRIVVVANRLPVHRVDGEWSTSPGGLVSALRPLLERRDGVWIGWTGNADDGNIRFELDGIDHVGIPLSETEIQRHYRGFSNASLWPLLHDAVRTPEFHDSWWSTYAAVNRRFADAAAEIAGPGDLIWIHDYHLMLTPGLIRERSPRADIRFFLHIPFPPIEIFGRLPWRQEIVSRLLSADTIGFQTERSADNFIEAAVAFGGASRSINGVTSDSQRTEVVAAPISIDFSAFDRLARSPKTTRRAARLRKELGNPEHVILGADRLDYTKGIDVRLRAFGAMLERYPELAEKTRFVQVAAPSRENVDGYEAMREKIEAIAGRINGLHGGRHHAPVHYTYESLGKEELVTYYKAADVMAVTPLADGMNLVAKEYVATRVDEDGSLLLSEFAGSATELVEAFTVNPYDIEGTAERMAEAIYAEPEERRRRMRAMRATIADHDVEDWSRQALGSSAVRALAG